MADSLFGNIFGGFKFSLNILLSLILLFAFLFLLIFLIKKIRELREFNILVEITPVWSIREEKVKALKEKKSLFGKPKLVSEEIPIQTSFSQFTAGRYIMDYSTGSYSLILKKPKTIIRGIPYVDPVTKEPFIKQINFGRYKRYIHLIRYSPVDFKPVVGKIDYKKVMEVKNIYDSDAINIAQQTYRDSLEKYKKGSKLEKYAPFIFVIILAIIMFIGIYFQWKGMENFTKQLSGLVSALSQLTEKLVIATK